MKSIAIKKSLLIAPIVLGSMLIPFTSAHADYTIDPRFVGNSNIGVKLPLVTSYSFHHGNAPGLPSPVRNGHNVFVGGYWSGKVDVTAHYMFTSMDKLVMLDANGRGSENTATVHGRGFYDANFLAKAGYVGFTEYNIRYPERAAYNVNDNGNNIINILNNPNNNIFFGSIHYNADPSMAEPTYLRSTSPGLKNSYVVSANADGKFTPFDAVNRTYWHNNQQTDRRAVWEGSRLTEVSIDSTQNDIKWLNNTTGVTDNTPDHIAPSGQYLINDNHDGDRKMLSWTTGDTNSNNKYYTTGDTVSFRNMSPIIQDGGKNGGLTAFRNNQVFRQSIWIPDGFDYTDGTARLYAIKTDGSRVDVTSRASFVLSRASYDSVSNWSADGSTTTDMHRLVATVTNIRATGDGDYNNSSTIGYSLIVPTKVNATAHTDKPYAIRGGSQILNGEWHDTGTDKVYIWNPSKPASTPTSSNAVVFNNGSGTDFSENSAFYDGAQYANNKTFRTNEYDGYYVRHNMSASEPVPSNVLSNKGANSSIDTWMHTKPLVFSIPYDNRYVKPIGGNVVRKRNSESSSSATEFEGSVGTNGITGQDTGSAYVITVPATLLNGSRNDGYSWGAAMKYRVNDNIPGKGVQIGSQPFTVDDASGTQNASTVSNYLVTPSSSSYLTTLTKNNTQPFIWYGAESNDTVHFVNGQKYGYVGAFYQISGMNGSAGVGEPMKRFVMSTEVKNGQIPTDVYVYKNNNILWHGSISNNSTQINGEGVSGLGGVSKADMANAFTGSISNSDNKTSSNSSLSAVKKINIQMNDNLRNDKHALYDTEDYFHIAVVVRDDNAAALTNLVNKNNEMGTSVSAFNHLENGLTSDTGVNLNQRISRVLPGGMIMPHDVWPANVTDDSSTTNLNDSSIQAREVYDYRVSQFLGNSSLKTEAYGTPFSMKVDAGSASTPSGTPVVKAYGLDGSVQDVSKDFTFATNGKVVTATMNDAAVNTVGTAAGQVYNKLYVLSVPLKNQTDTSVTVKNQINAWSSINGQELPVSLMSEFIPPETPLLYGYSATSSANSFDPKNPEKDKGKIAANTADGKSKSAQISTAPVQWVIREQLGDMTNHAQKYAYKKFTAEFANIPLFENAKNVSWNVYNEAGTNVSSSFKGVTTSGSGFKITATDAFLQDMSKYGHKYYFVINQTTQNNHKNRAAANAIFGVGGWFNNIRSTMLQFAAKIGIGNTDKTANIPDFDIQHQSNLLQINSTPSNLNEKTSQLNVTGYLSDPSYNIKNVQLTRTVAGYTVTGVALTYADMVRAYDSNKATFTASTPGNVNSTQRITPGSVTVTDMNNKDVTSQYTVNVVDGEKVEVIAKPEALSRLDKLHSVYGQNATGSETDLISFHVDTWGDRSTPTTVTWVATQNINGYDDAKSIERVTIPKAHAGKKEIFVSPAGKNQWQSTDYTLQHMSDLVDLKLKITVPNDLHNKDFTDFIIHDIASEITPFAFDYSATATVALGDNNDRNVGATMKRITQNISSKSLTGSRVIWELPDTIVTQLNTTNALDKMPTYTVIIRNVSMAPSYARTPSQYVPFLQHLTGSTADATKHNDVVKIPVGGVTSSVNGNQSDLNGTYFEGKSGALVDSTIGSVGSGATLGSNSGLINIILPQDAQRQEAYINADESNTSFTGSQPNGY